MVFQPLNQTEFTFSSITKVNTSTEYKKCNFTFPAPVHVQIILVHGLDIHIANHSLAYVHAFVQWLRDLVHDLYYYNTNLCVLVENHENVATSEHCEVWNDESEMV